MNRTADHDAFACDGEMDFAWRAMAVHHNDDKSKRHKRDEEITMNENTKQDKRKRSPAGPQPPMPQPLAVLVFVCRPREEYDGALVCV